MPRRCSVLVQKRSPLHVPPFEHSYYLLTTVYRFAAFIISHSIFMSVHVVSACLVLDTEVAALIIFESAESHCPLYSLVLFSMQMVSNSVHLRATSAIVGPPGWRDPRIPKLKRNLCCFSRTTPIVSPVAVPRTRS